MYDLKTHVKLIKLMEKHFSLDETKAIKESLNDNAVVMVLNAKTDNSKEFLSQFKGQHNEITKSSIETLKNGYLETDKLPTKVKVSESYISWAVKFLGILTDCIVIHAKADYPLMLENDDFSVIIAPRIEQ